MHVFFTTVQIPEPRLNRIEAQSGGVERHDEPTVTPWTEIHRSALEQSKTADFADPDCSDWT